MLSALYVYLHVIVINYSKPVDKSKYVLFLNCNYTEWLFLCGKGCRESRQCLISIVVMRLSCQLNMCQFLIAITVNCISFNCVEGCRELKAMPISIVIMRLSN